MNVPPVTVSADDVRDELDHDWRDLDTRAAGRERHGGYGASHVCYGCRLFVSGPEVTCPRCGYMHGGVNHRAASVR